MDSFVSDTMAVILWLEKRRMPKNAKEIFSRAEKNEVKLYVPAMVVVEVGYLSEKKKIEISLHSVVSYINKFENITLKVVDADVIQCAFKITDIPELHDRLIAAAGMQLNCPIITNDPKIIASQFVANIWD